MLRDLLGALVAMAVVSDKKWWGDERRGARVFILKRVVTKFIHSEQRTTVSEGQRKAVYSDSTSI